MPMNAAPDRDEVTHTWKHIVLVVSEREVRHSLSLVPPLCLRD